MSSPPSHLTPLSPPSAIAAAGDLSTSSSSAQDSSEKMSGSSSASSAASAADLSKNLSIGKKPNVNGKPKKGSLQTKLSSALGVSNGSDPSTDLTSTSTSGNLTPSNVVERKGSNGKLTAAGLAQSSRSVAIDNTNVNRPVKTKASEAERNSRAIVNKGLVRPSSFGKTANQGTASAPMAKGLTGRHQNNTNASVAFNVVAAKARYSIDLSEYRHRHRIAYLKRRTEQRAGIPLKLHPLKTERRRKSLITASGDILCVEYLEPVSTPTERKTGTAANPAGLRNSPQSDDSSKLAVKSGGSSNRSKSLTPFGKPSLDFGGSRVLGEALSFASFSMGRSSLSSGSGETHLTVSPERRRASLTVLSHPTRRLSFDPSLDSSVVSANPYISASHNPGDSTKTTITTTTSTASSSTSPSFFFSSTPAVVPSFPSLSLGTSRLANINNTIGRVHQTNDDMNNPNISESPLRRTSVMSNSPRPSSVKQITSTTISSPFISTRTSVVSPLPLNTTTTVSTPRIPPASPRMVSVVTTTPTLISPRVPMALASSRSSANLTSSKTTVSRSNSRTGLTTTTTTTTTTTPTSTLPALGMRLGGRSLSITALVEASGGRGKSYSEVPSCRPSTAAVAAALHRARTEALATALSERAAESLEEIEEPEKITKPSRARKDKKKVAVIDNRPAAAGASQPSSVGDTVSASNRGRRLSGSRPSKSDNPSDNTAARKQGLEAAATLSSMTCVASSKIDGPSVIIDNRGVPTSRSNICLHGKDTLQGQSLSTTTSHDRELAVITTKSPVTASLINGIGLGSQVMPRSPLVSPRLRVGEEATTTTSIVDDNSILRLSNKNKGRMELSRIEGGYASATRNSPSKTATTTSTVNNRSQIDGNITITASNDAIRGVYSRPCIPLSATTSSGPRSIATSGPRILSRHLSSSGSQSFAYTNGVVGNATLTTFPRESISNDYSTPPPPQRAHTLKPAHLPNHSQNYLLPSTPLCQTWTTSKPTLSGATISPPYTTTTTGSTTVNPLVQTLPCIPTDYNRSSSSSNRPLKAQQQSQPLLGAEKSFSTAYGQGSPYRLSANAVTSLLPYGLNRGQSGAALQTTGSRSAQSSTDFHHSGQNSLTHFDTSNQSANQSGPLFALGQQYGGSGTPSPLAPLSTNTHPSSTYRQMALGYQSSDQIGGTLSMLRQSSSSSATMGSKSATLRNAMIGSSSIGSISNHYNGARFVGAGGAVKRVTYPYLTQGSLPPLEELVMSGGRVSVSSSGIYTPPPSRSIGSGLMMARQIHAHYTPNGLGARSENRGLATALRRNAGCPAGHRSPSLGASIRNTPERLQPSLSSNFMGKVVTHSPASFAMEARQIGGVKLAVGRSPALSPVHAPVLRFATPTSMHGISPLV